MKYLFNERAAIFFLFFSIFGTTQTFSQVGIGTTTPNVSAALDIVSTDGGILIPRMTQAQISALTVDASTTGLLVYQTDNTPGFYYYNGTAWGTFGGGVDNDWTIVGNDMYSANSGNVGVGTTTPQVKLHVEAIAPGFFNDGFEDNTLAPFTSTNWFVTSTAAEVQTGTYAASSGAIGNNGTSFMEYTATVPTGGASLSFAYGVSSEANFDFFRFYIDGVQQIQQSGIVGYTTATFNLTAGSRILRWEYTKDVSNAVGSDKAYVDDVVIAPTLGSSIRIVDGRQAAGKVLTSDANGSASWQTPTTDSDWTINGNDMYSANSGNVGVGTASPTHGLHVEHNEDNAGVMKIQNNTAGGFAGIYFNQNGAYRGHIGYVNTGGASTFAEKGTFQIVSGSRDIVMSNTTATDESFSETLRVTRDKKLRITRNTGSNYWETYVDNSSNDYNFAYNGTLKSYIKSANGAYQTASDRRLKDNIFPISDLTTEKVLALNPVNYHYKNDESKQLQNGFIAQEVQALFPEIVDEKNGYLSVNYDAFGVLAIKALQEQQKTINLQEDKIKHLEDEISTIKQMLLDKK